MPRKLLSQVDAFAPTDSQQVRRRLRLGATISRYLIRFTGNLVVTATATLAEDAPLGYLRSVDLVLNGGFPLRSLDARGIRFLNTVQQETPPQLTAPSGAIGTTAFVGEISIDLAQVDLLPPLDSYFWMDSTLLSGLELVFTFGAVADIILTGTATLTALNVVIYAEEVADYGGVTSRIQISRIQQAIAATGDLDLQLPALGPVYRGLAAHFTSANADPIRATSDDTILNTISVIADNLLRHIDSAPYRMVRADNKMLYALETMPAGWIFLDWARSKTVNDLLATGRTRQLTVRLNIAAAPANSFVQLYPMNGLLVTDRSGRLVRPAFNRR
jgi:hypothetical protein